MEAANAAIDRAEALRLFRRIVGLRKALDIGGPAGVRAYVAGWVPSRYYNADGTEGAGVLLELDPDLRPRPTARRS